jgi:uncharacterized protein YhbP (UPF0306 family)
MGEEPEFQNPNIESFLKRNHIAVLATADKSTAMPQAAAVYYATDSKMNLFFLTKDGTAKAKNLVANPYAAVVIFEADTQTTAQISGPVSKVEDPVMVAKAQKVMAKYSNATAGTEETPVSKLYAGNYVLFKLWPQNIRLGEYKYGVKFHLFDTATPTEESLE